MRSLLRIGQGNGPNSGRSHEMPAGLCGRILQRPPSQRVLSRHRQSLLHGRPWNLSRDLARRRKQIANSACQYEQQKHHVGCCRCATYGNIPHDGCLSLG